MRKLGVALRDTVNQFARSEVGKHFKGLQAAVRRLETRLATQEKQLAALARMKGRGLATAGRMAVRGTESVEMSSSEIKALRARVGATQKQFAKLARVTPVAVYFWESGRTRPRGKSLVRLGEVKGMSRSDVQAILGEAPGGKKPGRKPGKQRMLAGLSKGRRPDKPRRKATRRRRAS